MSYITRVVDRLVERNLRAAGGVVLEGARGCGKTATARQAAASEVLLDVDAQARRAAQIDPALVLEGPAPRLIDEWQIEPAIWNHVRRAIDSRGGTGHFILTGSATPSDDVTRHTGAGRLIRLRMRPMTLAESGHSTSRVSLTALLAGEVQTAPDPELSITALVGLIARGGWPGLRDLDTDSAVLALRGYIAEVSRTDVAEVDGGRDPARVARMLRAVGRNVATEVTLTELARDLGGAAGSAANATARGYLDVLERIMLLEEQPAWSPSLRSAARLRRAAKRHLVDPSLAVAALGATPATLLNDLTWTGSLFESLVVRDLRVFAEALGGAVYHYRDNTGLEADAIIELPDGTWGGFEVKLAYSEAEKASRGLLRLAEKVTRPPAVLAVVVPSGISYRRDDGVHVVAMGALGE